MKEAITGKNLLIVLLVCISCLLLPACTDHTGENTPVAGIWKQTEVNDPIWIEYCEDGTYIKYQESIGRENPLDTGLWTAENNLFTIHTTKGLDGSINETGITMPYTITTTKTSVTLEIENTGDNYGYYFEGIKTDKEDNK